MKKADYAWRGILVWVLVAALAPAALGELTLPKVFGDHMVLQREMAVPVWGKADAGAKVTVNFAGQTKTATADADGKWMVKLDALKASAEGRELKVTAGEASAVFKDVLVGDVWVASGQSNMEFRLHQCDEPDDIKNAVFPQLRWIDVAIRYAGYPQDDIAGGDWVVCSPETAGGASGTAFYFARRLLRETGIPQGILDSNVGGTHIERWTEPHSWKDIPALATLYRQNERFVEKKDPGGEPHHPFTLYNGMIAPLIPYAIKGTIWYQGEWNAFDGFAYYYKMHALVNGWRKAWGQPPSPGSGAPWGRFPFYFVQLPGWRTWDSNPRGETGWAYIRDAQRRSLDIPDTGMAVTIDAGPPEENGWELHPKNKFDVGERLALWALAKNYGKEIVCSGPLYKSFTVEGNTMRIAFDHVNGGLMVGRKEGKNPAVEDKEGALNGFTIRGLEDKWYWADAKIDGNTVMLSHPNVKTPLAARYAFRYQPLEANLYNCAGLPASPFRTDPVGILPEDVERAMGAGVYLDLVSGPEGFTRKGLTARWSNHEDHAWGAPSMLQEECHVDGDGDRVGDCAASKDGDAPVIRMDITGLAADSPCEVWAVAAGNNFKGGLGFKWGAAADALTEVPNVCDAPRLAAVTRYRYGDRDLYAVRLGEWKSDGNGALALYLGAAGDETQLDGAVVSASKLSPPVPYRPEEIRVGPENTYSFFSPADNPESPDGKRIAYLVFDAPPPGPASLYVCDRDLKDARLVKKLEDPVDGKVGAFVQWIDNDSIAYSGHEEANGAVRVVNAESGELELGPFQGAYCCNSAQGNLLINVPAQGSPVGQPGLYLLDTKTGKVRPVLKPADTGKLKDVFEKKTDDPAQWTLADARLSPDGERLALMVKAEPNVRYPVTCKLDGSEMCGWPVGQEGLLWFDNDTLFKLHIWETFGKPFPRGARHQKRFKPDGTVVERVAGVAWHADVSPDRKWVVGDPMWASSFEIRIFEYGVPEPYAVWSRTNVGVDTNRGGFAYPRFSRDGTRIYYNKTITDKQVEATCCESPK